MTPSSSPEKVVGNGEIARAISERYSNEPLSPTYLFVAVKDVLDAKDGIIESLKRRLEKYENI